MSKASIYTMRYRLLFASLCCCQAASADTLDQAPETPTPAALDQIEVVGRAQTLYAVPQSDFATRTPTVLQDTPQSVQVINRELIEDQAARQITDLYRNVAGVSAFSYAGVTSRGFRQEELLYDGLRGDPYNGFALPQLFSIDQVVFLKGPAGALYGAGQPGGLINYVTKKASPATTRKLELQIGDDGYRAGSVEVSGSFDSDQRYYYRVGLYRDSEDPFRRNTSLDNTLIDLGLGMALGDKGELQLIYSDIDQRYGGARLRGVPVDAAGNFLTRRDWNHNEASDFQDLQAQVWLLTGSYHFSPFWRLEFSARHYDNVELQQYHEPFGLEDRDGDGRLDYSRRQFRDQQRHNSATATATNLIAELDWGSVAHTWLMGVDTLRSEGDLASRLVAPIEAGGIVPGLSLINPIYGSTGAQNYDLVNVAPRLSASESVRQGLYLQDQMTLGSSWELLLGLRHDRFDDRNALNGQRYSGSGNSYRVGLLRRLREGLNAYLSYGEGFVPQSISSQDPLVGGPFDPEQSQLQELGLKSNWLDERIRINAAIYQIDRENILQSDPRGDLGNDGRDDLALLGHVRSRGGEIEVIGDLTQHWVLSAAYGYNDTRIREATSAVSNAVGDRFANAPMHQFGLWTRYDLPTLASAVSLGADYVSEQVSISGQPVRSYTIFDASWQTLVGDWLLQLNLKNLFDREYAVSGFIDRTGHFPGEPRRVYLRASYQF